MKYIDLCCGIGGFHYALKNLGFECVLASDINEKCRENYALNHGIVPVGDLTGIDIPTIPQFDILCAGFPCQPFSKAGDQKGFGDRRGNIFFNICDMLEHHRPKYVILENVRNLASHDKGNTWKVIKDNLSALGYLTYNEPVILNTLDFGVPQSRERVVIMCKRQDLGELPDIGRLPKERVETALSSIVECDAHAKYKIAGKFKETEEVWDDFVCLCGTNSVPVPKFPLWTDWWDGDGEGTSVTKYNDKLSQEENAVIIKKRQDDFYEKYTNWIGKNREFYNTNRSFLDPWLSASRARPLWKGAVRKMEWQSKRTHARMSEVLWSARGSGIRVKDLNYAPTLVAMASMIPVYGPKSRFLTPRECARLQSFPDDYKIHKDDKVSYTQFGNAVNVKMIETCARFFILQE